MSFPQYAPCCSRWPVQTGSPGLSKQRRTEDTPVTVATVTNVSWDRTVSITGTLYPKDEATLGAQVEGAVEKTLVDFGDRIVSQPGSRVHRHGFV
jgi:multidrug efflux pump subunit AcrA (membrane-fusion protein)